MTYNRTAVAYWVNQFNAEVTLLNTRTSERDSARNSLFIGGVYNTGPTWQAQDASDAALAATANSSLATCNNSLATCNSSLATCNTALAAANAAKPAALDYMKAVGADQPADGTTRISVANLVTDRAGQWVVVWRANNTNGSPSPTTLFAYVNGGLVATVIANCSTAVSAYMPLGHVWSGIAGTGVQFRTDVSGTGGAVVQATCEAWFVPTPAYPN